MDILPEKTAQTIDKSIDNELIYLSAIICHKLTELQNILESKDLENHQMKFDDIFEIKERWIKKFLSTHK